MPPSIRGENDGFVANALAREFRQVRLISVHLELYIASQQSSPAPAESGEVIPMSMAA